MTADAAGVPRGVPASGAGAVVDLIAADPPPEIRSVYSDLLDQALSAPRSHVTRWEVWVEEPNTRAGGRWVEVEG
jgi:hypothetical protein